MNITRDKITRDKIAEIIEKAEADSVCCVEEVADQILDLFEGYMSPEEVEEIIRDLEEETMKEFDKFSEEVYQLCRDEMEQAGQECINKLGHLIDPSALATRKVKEKCGDCGGSGCKYYKKHQFPLDKGQGCKICKNKSSCTMEDWFEPCTPCSGTGKVEVEEGAFVKCERCKGKGYWVSTGQGIGEIQHNCNCTDGYRQITTGEQLERNDWEWRRVGSESFMLRR